MAEQPLAGTAHQIAAALAPFKGQRLVGVVDGYDCVEIVFSKGAEGLNMLTLWFDEGGVVTYAQGGVSSPEVYVDACGVKP